MTMQAVMNPTIWLRIGQPEQRFVCEQTERFDHMSKHRTSAESFANSLCRDTGHDWMLTTAANWRVCKRERCRASERLVDGLWVSNATLYRFHDPVVEYGRRARAPKQSALWEQ